MNTFTVNEKVYTAKPFNFRVLRDLGRMGVRIEEIDKNPLPIIEGYFRICSGLDEDTAVDEIASMEDVNAIMEALSKEMNDADFFRTQHKATKKVVATSKPKAVKA